MASSLRWRQAVRSMDCNPAQWSARLRRDRLSTHSQWPRPRCCRCRQLKDTATREWRVSQAHPPMSTLCRCKFWPITGSSSLSVTLQFCNDRFWRTLLSFSMEQNAFLGTDGPICKHNSEADTTLSASVILLKMNMHTFTDQDLPRADRKSCSLPNTPEWGCGTACSPSAGWQAVARANSRKRVEWVHPPTAGPEDDTYGIKASITQLSFKLNAEVEKSQKHSTNAT